MARKKMLGPDAQDIALRRARNLGENAAEARDVWERVFRKLQQLQSASLRIAA